MSEYSNMVNGVNKKIDNDAVRKFLERVKQDADSLCIDFCIVAEGGKMAYSDNWSTSALGKEYEDPEVEAALNSWRERNKWPTFMELYEYIQTAEVDEQGYHNFGEKRDPKTLSGAYLRIHEGRTTVDLFDERTELEGTEHVCRFVFNKNGDMLTEVDIYDCKFGVNKKPNYSLPMNLNFRIEPDKMDDAIEDGNKAALDIRYIIRKE